MGGWGPPGRDEEGKGRKNVKGKERREGKQAVQF